MFNDYIKWLMKHFKPVLISIVKVIIGNDGYYTEDKL